MFKKCIVCDKPFAFDYSKKTFCSNKCFHKSRKGKTYEELYGKERAEVIKEKISKKLLGENNIIYKNCLHCNKLFWVYPHSKKRKFCSHQCYGEYKKEKPMEKHIKDKISKTLKGKSYDDIFGVERAKEIRKKHSIAAKGKICSHKDKTYEEIYGVEEAIKEKYKRGKSISKTHRKLSASERHYKEIVKQTKILEEQGFRCVPIGKVIPDIIAIKDDKVFAVEVEKSNNPNWDKYTDDVRLYFDDIVWILIRENKKIVIKR